MEILGVGPMELLVILVLLLLVFGPDRLPEIGAKLGKGVRSMRRATRDFSEELQQARDAIEKPASQIAAPIQELAKPIQEIAEPFEDVKASALAVSQAAKSIRNPGQAIRDSVMQSAKPSEVAPVAGAATAEGDVSAQVTPASEASQADSSGESELATSGSEQAAEGPQADASDAEG